MPSDIFGYFLASRPQGNVLFPGGSEGRELLRARRVVKGKGETAVLLTLGKERPLTVPLVHQDDAPVSNGSLAVAMRSGEERWSCFGSESPSSQGLCSFLGLGPTERRLTLARDDIDASATCTPSTTFRCAPGSHEIVAFAGDSPDTVKIIATVKVSATPGGESLVELSAKD